MNVLTTNKSNNNNNNNNEDNRNHFFVNLSRLLLREILLNFDDCLDIISFSLVCKRWFQERNSYLDFNNTTLGRTLRFFNSSESFDKGIKSRLKTLDTINDYNLKSYHYQIQNTITNNEDESILFMYENGEVYIQFVDLLSNDRLNYKEILKNNKYKKLYYTINQPSLETYLEEIKMIDDFATSKVSMAMKTTSMNLINLSHLSFIREIEFHGMEYQPLPIEFLPSCLEALTLGRMHSPIVDLAKLPTTLKYLSLDMKYYEPIESLPKSLEELRFGSDYDFILDETILPATLHTLIGISNRIAPGTYRSLKKLFIAFKEDNLHVMPTQSRDIIEIPSFVEELTFYHTIINGTLKLPITSLTKLTLDVNQIELFGIDDNSTTNNLINSNNNNTGFIPSSVVYLKISTLTFSQNSPFSISLLLKSPNTSQLKTFILKVYMEPILDINSFTFGNREDGIGLDSLQLDFYIREDRLIEGIVPNGIKEFTLNDYKDASALSPTFVPSSVEKLNIIAYTNPFKIPIYNDDDNTEDTINIVPSNVRHINIHGSSVLKCYDCIPISIKSFTVKDEYQDYHFRRLDENHFIMMSDNHLHFKPRCGIIKESTILNSNSLFELNK